ncbi:MAG: hypothetical protein H0V01_00115 [Bacteroidetes bacterium]|nr:hypothetical protein [Bacteroidota bacterium]HET6244923.1 hypothetical protein [Bacteroidia bacterium]
MEYLRIAAALILYLRKQISYPTGGTWIEWRETILPVLENQIDAGTINAAINSGKIAAGKIKSPETLHNLLSDISIEDRIKITEIIYLFRIIDEKRNDYIPDTFNVEAWGKLINNLGLSDEQNEKAKHRSNEWYELKKENRFKTKVYVPASILPISLDFLLRCIVLFAFQSYGMLENKNIGPLFIFTQVVIIPLLIAAFAIRRDREISQYGQYLVSKINIKNIQFKIKNSAWHYLFIFILTAIGSFVPVLFSFEELPLALVIALFFIYGIYLMILQTNFSKSKPQYKHIKLQLEEKEHQELSGELNSDQNDEEIINLEVNLKAENERMDAYVIEAALFGALAFSGFLQIVSAGDFSVEFIDSFNRHVFLILKAIVNPAGQNVYDSCIFIFSNNGLMVLLCYQALFCSVFFLSVIGSRLRYSKLTDYVDRYLQLAKSLNEKEEFLMQKENKNNSKVILYSTKIQLLLREGYKKQNEILPIMEFMKFFRTLGISMFFIIIVTSGLFISPWLSAILFFVAMLSMIYFMLGSLKAAIKSFYITMQEFYYRVDKPVHWICWSVIILALVLRTFRLPLGGFIMAAGFMFLFIHYLMNLFIPIIFDFDHKKAEDAFGSHSNFQKILAYLFKIALAIFFLGFMFKALHWPGAGPLLIVSILMLCAYFIMVKKVNHGPLWIGYLLSIAISMSFINIIFKMQHWPGNMYIPYVAIPLILITGAVTFLNRDKIRPIFKRTVYILCFMAVAFYFNYTRESIMHLNLNYDIYLTQKKKTDFMNQFYDGNGGIQDYLEMESDSVANFLNEFNQLYVQVERDQIDTHLLNKVSWDVYENINNPIVLNAAVNWSAKSIEGYRSWESLDTYASLLYKVERYEEAKPIAEEAFKLGNQQDTKLLLDKILLKLQNTADTLKK